MRVCGTSTDEMEPRADELGSPLADPPLRLARGAVDFASCEADRPGRLHTVARHHAQMRYGTSDHHPFRDRGINPGDWRAVYPILKAS